MMSHWAKNVTRLGRDGYKLARAVVRHRGTTPGGVKPILLDHARQSNAVAASLLYVDKEVGLVRYYGLSGYIKRRLQSTSALTTASDGSSSEGVTSGGGNNGNGNSSSSSSSTARIAFMVTASMKQELSERLGYDAEQVKSMTPLQASLILNENIKPDEMTTKLPIAEQEYEMQRQKEEEEARLRAEEEQQLNTISLHHQPTAAAAPLAAVSTGDDAPPMLNSNTTQMFNQGEGYRSRNEYDVTKHNKIGTFFSASEWFEVTETNAKGETSRVGLYQDKAEAELGLQTRQEIAEAKQTNLKFGMNRIAWMDLE